MAAGLTSAQLVSVLSVDTLNVESEEDVFRGLEAWWDAQPAKPPVAVLAALLRSIRFSQMEKDFVRGHVRQAQFMQTLEATHAVSDALLEGATPRKNAQFANETFTMEEGDSGPEVVPGRRPTVGERFEMVAVYGEEHETLITGANEDDIGKSVTLLMDDFTGCPFMVVIDGHPSVSWSKPGAFDLTRRAPWDEDKVRHACALEGMSNLLPEVISRLGPS